MEKVYAQALQSLLSKEGANETQILDQLFAHLKATGRMKLLPGIKRELQKAQDRTHMQEAQIEVAHKDESDVAIAEAGKLGIHATRTHVNPSLIRGWRARQGSQLIDHSGKRALVDLYRRITA